MLELSHHGILGQKWGIRRFQNKDGSLTAAGRKRYNVDIERAQKEVENSKRKQKAALRQYYQNTPNGRAYSQKAQDAVNYANKEVKWAKDDLKAEKIKEKLNNEKKKSQHRLKLEKQYKEKGMSDEEAAIAAYKREHTEKALAVVAGLTVTAAAAYAVHKHYDQTVDKFIKKGVTLQNVSINSNKGVQDAFYASMTKMDNTKYRGIHAHTLSYPGQNVYETKIGVKKNLKVASEKNAVRALSDLVGSDKKYRNDLENHLADLQSLISKSNINQRRVVDKGLDSLRKGKIDKNVYRALNFSLPIHGLSTSAGINKGYYDKLTSMGYDAIMDYNDKKISGYMSSKPIIVFNGAAKTAVSNIRQLGQDEIEKARKAGMFDITVKQLIPKAAGTAAGIGSFTAGLKITESRNNDKIVADYRAKHPNTELSYNEIVRMSTKRKR